MRSRSSLVVLAPVSTALACRHSEPGSQTESAPATGTTEKDVLKCEVRQENAGDLPGTSDVWSLSVKVSESALKITYASETKGQVSIVYPRLPEKDTGNDNTRYVFHVKPELTLAGGGGPRIIETDNDVKHPTPIGDFLDNLSHSTSMIILAARKDEQF